MAALEGPGEILVEWRPDGTQLLTTSNTANPTKQDKSARVWNARTGVPVAVFPTNGWEKAYWVPNGMWVIITEGGMSRMWEARSPAALTVLGLTVLGGRERTGSTRWNPDGTRVLTIASHADKIPRIWDARTGAVVAVLEGHTGPVNDAAWSPDGTRVVTASDDGTARVWDAATGAAVEILKGALPDGAAQAGVLSASWSPDGARIFTDLFVWEARTGAMLERFRWDDKNMWSGPGTTTPASS